MSDERDIVERLESEALRREEIHPDDSEIAVMREAAALIRALDESVANLVAGTMPAHVSEWARPALTAAAARHAARHTTRVYGYRAVSAPVPILAIIDRRITRAKHDLRDARAAGGSLEGTLAVLGELMDMSEEINGLTIARAGKL